MDEDRRAHQERVARMQAYRTQQLVAKQEEDRKRVEALQERRLELSKRVQRVRSQLEREPASDAGSDAEPDGPAGGDEDAAQAVDKCVLRVSCFSIHSRTNAMRRSHSRRTHLSRTPCLPRDFAGT